MTIVGLLVAAGRGERLGASAPKAFVACAGRPLLEWSLDVLAAVCDRVVVAVPPGREGEVEGAVTGADSRSGSVRAALAAAPEAELALVHDAARPLVTRELAERCVAGLGGRWDGAVAAAPLTDTLKQALPEDRRVVRTLPREGLWAVQTPQAFRADVLRRALAVDDAALAAASDDASLVEAAGGAVTVVEAPPDNLKVTSRFDLRVAEAALHERAPADRAASPTRTPGARPASGSRLAPAASADG